MVDFLKKILPYDITIVVTILAPIIMVLYRFWLKNKFDSKLERMKSDLQKEFKKHDIRLKQYKEFYQTIDTVQKDLKIQSESYALEVARKAEQLTLMNKPEEALNFNTYIKNIQDLNTVIFEAIHKIRHQANEFRFYASDELLEYLDQLDSEYEKYNNSLLNIDNKLLEETFNNVINGNFLEMFASLATISQTKVDSPSGIQNLHEKIKSLMRKELNLNE
jgi:hypothetical protein